MPLSWKKLLNEKRLKTIDSEDSKSTSSNSESLIDEGNQFELSDARHAFEKDYDRAIFSTPVRRLQDKTQVFPLAVSDFVRTRLTHSQEVSSMASGLTRTALSTLDEDESPNQEQTEKLSTIARTCGLLHDLGNPPFGHAGEEAMREWFEKKLEDTSDDRIEEEEKADLKNFNANAQTFRLVSKLQALDSDHGLNLTAGTLSALLKYLSSGEDFQKGNTGVHSKENLGYFVSEREYVKKVSKKTGTLENGDTDGGLDIKRNPVTLLVESADDIVYSLVDIEDAFAKDIITWEEFKEKIDVDWSRLKVDKSPIDFAEDYVKGQEYTLKMSQSEKHTNYLQMFRTKVASIHINFVSEVFKNNFDKIKNGNYDKELLNDSKSNELKNQCESIKEDYVYDNKEVLKLEVRGREIIHSLMDFFWEGCQDANPNKSDVYDLDTDSDFADKSWKLMSQNYKAIFASEEDHHSDLYLQLKIIGDYVSGMTDNFASRLHKTINNTN